ncbi:unnamed protein product [Schistosoma rodhaini]|nr:unnamed protein product [Schistosoma rodhaini]
MMTMTNLSKEQDENNQDVLEFEDNLEKMSRDLVTDILNRARSAITHESLDTKQIMLPSQDFASSQPQLSITTPSPPKYVGENDKNVEECANAFGITPVSQKSVINEEIQPSNVHEDLTIQQAPSEEKLPNQYQTKFDFKSNILNDFRGIGVGSATPDTPRQRDYQWKSGIDLPPTNNTPFTHSYNYPQKPVYLREMSLSPPSLSCDLIKDDLITSSRPTNSNCIDEFTTSCRMLTYRQDSPTVINTDDIEQKLKPFSTPLPIYIPSTACTRILKQSEVYKFTGDYNSQPSRLRYNDSEIGKLSHSDSISSELEKLSNDHKNYSYVTNKKQSKKPNIPRLQLPSSPKLSHSPKTNSIRIRKSSLPRHSIPISKSNNLKIPKSTSSSLCWWEPLHQHDTSIIESYNDKFNLPEPNPEVLKHYYYLCSQQPIKEATLMKAINEAEIQAKYNKIAHYEYLRQKSLQQQRHKRTRFLNSHQSRKFDMELKHLNKTNHHTTNNNNSSINSNYRLSLCRPEQFTHLLQKENKPNKSFQYPNKDDPYSIMMKKSKKQRSILSSTVHNRQKLKSKFSPIIYHLKPILQLITSSESSIDQRKEFETESETIDDTSDLEFKSSTCQTDISNSLDTITPTLLYTSKIPLTSQPETYSEDSAIQCMNSYYLTDINGKLIHGPIYLSSYEKDKPDRQHHRQQQQQQQQKKKNKKIPVHSLILPNECMNFYRNHQNTVQYVVPFIDNKVSPTNNIKKNNRPPSKHNQNPFKEKSFNGKKQDKYDMKWYKTSRELEDKDTQLNDMRSVNKRKDLKMNITKSNTDKSQINCHQIISKNHGNGKQIKSLQRHCSMSNLSNNSVSSKKLNSSLDSLQQLMKDHDTDCLDSVTPISDQETNENKNQPTEYLVTSENDDQTLQTFKSKAPVTHKKKDDFKLNSRRCQSVIGCKVLNNGLTNHEQMNRYSDRSFSHDLLCSRNHNKLPLKTLYSERKEKKKKNTMGNHTDRQRFDCYLSSSSKLSSKSKSKPRKVSSRSNSQVRSSLKVRNKSLDKNDNINHHNHFDHHERRLHSSNNRRTQISQSPIDNKRNTIKDSDYNRSIHSPISYFLNFNDKPDYNQHCTNLHSEYCHINKQNADSPTYIHSEYANNLPKQFHSTNLQTENNSCENELHNKSVHSRRNNLRSIHHPNSSFHRNSDFSSGSLDRLRRRCHSIERELGTIERDKYEQTLSNPIPSDPRVDALTSANRILRQRLYDIQKIQENREHVLNKAHEMVNGLLNKQQKQASIIRESTRNYAQTPSTLLTTNHDINDDDDQNRKSYPTNLYKPMIKEDSLNLPTYTPTKYGHYHNQHHLQCHHDPNHITDYYGQHSNQHSPYNYFPNQRKPFDFTNHHSTNVLLEKLRSDYADLANSVYRIEEKARDAASSVQSLLKQFQMGLIMEPVNFNSMNQLSNSDSYESFNKESQSNELYDKSVMFRLQKARDTLDQLKSDSFRPSINCHRQVDYTVPLTISVTTTTNSLLSSSSIPLMTTTSGTVPSKINHYNLHEPYLKHPNMYNHPYSNPLRSTWNIS